MTRHILFALALLITASTALAQAPRVALTGDEGRRADEAVVADLNSSGSRIERPRVIVWFQGGTVAPAEQQLWADRMNQGIEDTERFLGLKFDTGRITYFISDQVGVSHAVPPTSLYIALRRVTLGAVPYIHEAAHLFAIRHRKVQPTTGPGHVWAAEGFASYIEDAVVAEFGGLPGKLFTQGGNAGVHAEAWDVLNTPLGKSIAEFIGTVGAPPNINTDRENVARPFYIMAQSLTKYVVDTIGRERFVSDLFVYYYDRERFEQNMRAATGLRIEDLRTRWIDFISKPK